MADPVASPLEPLGDGDYVVKAGECMSSIAEATGHFWQTLWDHPRNAAIKEGRRDPNVLLSGDRVFVPELRERVVSVASDRRHTFKRLGVPERIRIRLVGDEGPRANEQYTFVVANNTRTGTTNGDGWVIEWIPPRAMSATLIIGDDTFDLEVGHLAPAEGEAGIRARLTNLGFLLEDDSDANALPRAFRRFQRAQCLPITGTLDEETRRKLIELHGS